MPTAKKTAPKKPQDRQPKAEPVVKPEDTPGFDLLRPFDEIPVWEQTPLIALLAELYDKFGDDARAEGESLAINDQLEVVGRLAKLLLEYAVDPIEFTKFASGRNALDRVTNLAMAWIGDLGE